jgi:hypothetical protein
LALRAFGESPDFVILLYSGSYDLRAGRDGWKHSDMSFLQMEVGPWMRVEEVLFERQEVQLPSGG